MKKSLIALTLAGVVTLTACGKETVYIVTEATEAPADEAPETTAKKTTTTTKPASTRPPSNVPATTGIYDPDAYDTFIWESANEFWWLFTQEQLLQMGLLVCEEFDRGQTLDQVTQSLVEIMYDTNTAYLAEGMAAVTASALTYLCSEHSYWLNTI